MTSDYSKTGNREITIALPAGFTLGNYRILRSIGQGRFGITYAAGGLTQEEVEGAGFKWMPYEEAAALYPPEKQLEGWNNEGTDDEYYYIGSPATGLWSV